MNTAMDYFKQAELAMAAYANLAIGTINATDLANSGQKGSETNCFLNTKPML